MADVFSKAKRSEVMSRVRGRGNKATELAMVALLRKQKISGWRRHVRVYGNPDFIFRERRLAVFVDGCFWHGCPKHATQPASNRAFWSRKLARNKARDRMVNRTLRARDWRILRVWQHELTRQYQFRLARRIRHALNLA